MSEEKIKKIYDELYRNYDYYTWPIEIFFLRKIREKVLSNLQGKILEIGIGTGANLSYYQKGVNLIGIDLSSKMLALAKQKAMRLDINLNTRIMSAENLQFDDLTFDAVVSTLTLCTIPDPIRAIKEMYRVTKKGGQLKFIEHGLSNLALISHLQKRFQAKHLTKHACHLIREPAEIVKSAGLHNIKLHQKFFGVISVFTVLT